MELQLCKEFVQTCPSTATSSLPEDTLLGGEVDLDGGVAPGVVDLASVDLLDGHPAGETADLKGSCTSYGMYYYVHSIFSFLSQISLSLRHITIAANGFLLPGEATAKEAKVKSRTEEMLSAHSLAYSLLLTS